MKAYSNESINTPIRYMAKYHMETYGVRTKKSCAVVTTILFLLTLAGCKDDEALPIATVYQLTIHVDPPDGGVVTGAGEYKEGDLVEISADPRVSWDFEGWTGHTDYLEDLTVKQLTFAMPPQDIALTAHFSYFHCGDAITFIYRGEEVTYGTIERAGWAWTSTVVENQSHAIGVSYSGLHAGMSASIRADGKGVRCVRDLQE